MERIKSYFNSIGPICIQEAKTQSFRGDYLCSTSYSTASPPFSLTHPLGSPPPCEDDDDSTTLPSSSSLSSDRGRKRSDSDELFVRLVASESTMNPQSGDGIFTQLLQDRDPNLLNDFGTAILTPQTTTEGTSKKTQRGVNFTHEEDKMLVSGWLSTSLDAIVGNDQKSITFWSRVHQYYHECKKPNFQERTVHSLTNRWSTIQRSVNKFCACLAQIENLHQSGHSENDKIKLAKASYKENENNEFTFEHCWEILRYQPKWILQKEEVKGKKRKVTCASPSTPNTINLGDEDLSSMSSHWERPQGKKAQKDQEKKKNHKEEKSKQLEAVVERITNDKKQLHDEKMAKIDMLVEIEKEKIKLKTEIEKEKVKQKDRLITMAEEEKNEKIMLMDISGLDEVQQEYIMKRRLQILQNMKN